MHKTLAIVALGIRQMLADPMYVIFTLGLPLMMTWAMSFIPGREFYEMTSLGVLVMFVAINLITSAGAILEERQHGTWARLLASPTSYWQIMGGFFIKLFLLAWVQTLILLLSGKFLFGAPWDRGYPEMFAVMTVYIMAMTGLGLFLAGILRTQGQVQAVAMTVVMIGSMLGGIFFPIKNPPPAIRVIEAISPQSWAAHALKDILISGASLSSLATGLLWLGGAGLVLLTAGVFWIKYGDIS